MFVTNFGSDFLVVIFNLNYQIKKKYFFFEFTDFAVVSLWRSVFRAYSVHDIWRRLRKRALFFFADKDVVAHEIREFYFVFRNDAVLSRVLQVVVRPPVELDFVKLEVFVDASALSFRTATC